VAELGTDGFGGGGGGVGCVEVNVDEVDVESFGLEGGGGLLAELRIASGGEDGPASLSDLAGDFEADALIGTGDERDLFLAALWLAWIFSLV
jgi:hypothetical protein